VSDARASRDGWAKRGAAARVARGGGRAAAVVVAVVLTACAATAQTYTDPFRYCAAVDTIDAPDARYTGAAVPPAVAQGLRRAFHAPADAPIETFTRGTSWRCADGGVYACNVGANLPCDVKADTSRTPSPPVAEFCRQNPTATVIPMVVTGRASIYEWRCAGGAPAIERQVTAPDSRGYLQNIWYPISPPAE
jgi:hypothetical protein